jgi:hypothetical protein
VAAWSTALKSPASEFSTIGSLYPIRAAQRTIQTQAQA